MIVAELAAKAGIDLSKISDDELVGQRREIMGGAFYEFTSGKDPQVDEHLIHQALDWWSWLWVVLESSLVFSLTGLTLISFGVYGLGIGMTFGSLAAAAIALPIIWNQCRRYAVAQVRSIMSDPTRARQVAEVLHGTIGSGRAELPGWHVNQAAVKEHSAAVADRWSRHIGR